MASLASAMAKARRTRPRSLLGRVSAASARRKIRARSWWRASISFCALAQAAVWASICCWVVGFGSSGASRGPSALRSGRRCGRC